MGLDALWGDMDETTQTPGARSARSALIVATGRYDDPALAGLRGAAADVDALAAVFGDPEIGGFDVQTVVDQPAHVVSEAVEEFFADRSPDDLLVLHFSGHGIKNQDGELHFAAANTRLTRLASTSVASHFVNRQMNASRSRRIVLLLDCCYAGAFDRGMTARGGTGVEIQERFEGRGRAVITASGALEYAFEGDHLTTDEPAQPSVFTTAMVRGLTTGEADRNQDGWVGLDELYDYVYDAVREVAPQQTPGKWTFGVQGDLHLARRGRPVTEPSPLPAELQQSVDSPLAGVRAGAVTELARLAAGQHAGLALAARLALGRLADDDSRTVAAAAAASLSGLAGVTPAQSPSTQPEGQSPRDAAPAVTAAPEDSLRSPTPDGAVTGADPPARHDTVPVAGRAWWRAGRARWGAAVAVVLTLVAAGLVGWQFTARVATVPSEMSGVWVGTTRIFETEVTLALYLTSGAQSGTLEGDDCRLRGTLSDLSGTRSTLTTDFEVSDRDPTCTTGDGTIVLTLRSDDVLLAEFQPDDGTMFWTAQLGPRDE